jgi:hypothetical protein
MVAVSGTQSFLSIWRFPIFNQVRKHILKSKDHPEPSAMALLANHSCTQIEEQPQSCRTAEQSLAPQTLGSMGRTSFSTSVQGLIYAGLRRIGQGGNAPH